MITDQVTEDTSQGTTGGPVCQIRIGNVTGSLSLTGPLCGSGEGNRSDQLNGIRSSRLIRAHYIY